MSISPMRLGLRGGSGKLALVSGLALMLVLFALPTFAFTAGEAATAAAEPQTSAPAAKCDSFTCQDSMFNWGGARQRWAEKGFTFNAFYITDALGDYDAPAGTDLVFVNWQRVRATVDYDFGKAHNAKGLAFHATGVWQNGNNLGGIIGSFANPSGIVSFHQFRLDSMWLQQSIAGGKVVITAGLMASQDFYGLQEYGGAFVTEPLDYNFHNMGNVRASYDPETGPGAEIKFAPTKHFYVKTGWFMPSDDSHVAGHEYRPTFANYRAGSYGSTWDIEGAWLTDAGAPPTRKSYPGIIKAGFIFNGSKAGSYNPIMGYSGFPDYSKEAYVDNNWTFYFQGNQPVLRTAAGSNRGLDVTFGFNIGPQSKSQMPTAITGGLIFNGPLPGRSKDGLAFGLVFSKIGDDYNNYIASLGSARLKNETEFEINYKLQVFPWFMLQPVWQFYNNVGGSDNSAGVAGLRLQATF